MMNSTSYWSQFPKATSTWYNIMGSMFLLVGVSGLTLNVVVICFIICIKENKLPGKYFLLNLALTDMLKMLINIPMTTTSAFHQSWMFGDIGCQIYGTIGGVLNFTSIMTLVFMSIERYLMVKNPFYSLKITTKVVAGCILFSWLYSLVCVIPQFFNHGFVQEGLMISCSFDYISRDIYSRSFMLSLFFGGFFIPVTIIIFFYSLILAIMRSRLNELKSLSVEKNVNKNEDVNFDISGIVIEEDLDPTCNKVIDSRITISSLMKKKYKNECCQSLRCSEVLIQKSIYCARLVRSELKLTKCIFFSVFFFCITWLPYAIMALYLQFSQERERFVTAYISSIPILLSKTSAILNPLIFTLKDPKFKKFFERRIILKQRYMLNPAMAREVDRTLQNTTDRNSSKRKKMKPTESKL